MDSGHRERSHMQNGPRLSWLPSVSDWDSLLPDSAGGAQAGCSLRLFFSSQVTRAVFRL